MAKVSSLKKGTQKRARARSKADLRQLSQSELLVKTAEDDGTGEPVAPGSQWRAFINALVSGESPIPRRAFAFER